MWLGQEQGISKKGLLSCFGLDMGHGKRGRSREKGLLSCLASGLGRGRKRGRRNRGFPKKAFFCLTSGLGRGRGARGQDRRFPKRLKRLKRLSGLGTGSLKRGRQWQGFSKKAFCLVWHKISHCRLQHFLSLSLKDADRQSVMELSAAACHLSEALLPLQRPPSQVPPVHLNPPPPHPSIPIRNNPLLNYISSRSRFKPKVELLQAISLF